MEKYYDYDRHDFDWKNGRRAMRPLLADPVLGRMFLPDDKNSAIGYLALAFGYSLDIMAATHLWTNFSYLKNTEARGSAARCLRMQKRLPKGGVRAIHLEVTRHNESVLQFLPREGFKEHDRHLVTKRV